MENYPEEQLPTDKWIEEYRADKLLIRDGKTPNVEYIIEEALKAFLGPRLKAQVFPFHVDPARINVIIDNKYRTRVDYADFSFRKCVSSICLKLIKAMNEKGTLVYEFDVDMNYDNMVTITGTWTRNVQTE